MYVLMRYWRVIWGTGFALLLGEAVLQQGGATWSLSRWLVVGALVILSVLPWWGKFCPRTVLRGWHRLPLQAWFGLTVLAFGMAAIPPERFPFGWRARQALLTPFWLGVAWACLWGGVHSAGFRTAWQQAQPWLLKVWTRYRRPWSMAFLVLLGGVTGILLSGWGFRTPWRLNWQGFPVPLLPQHLVGSLLGLGVMWVLTHRYPGWFRGRRWWFWGLTLWLVTWGLWWQTPPSENYFLSLPYPPRWERYPASDALTFVTRALQGYWGMGYGGSGGWAFLEKPGLYALLNLLAHLATSFVGLEALWIGVLALSSWAAYDVGCALHSRSLGLLLAATLVGREVVALISAHQLSVVHVQNLMSEPLLRLALLGLTAFWLDCLHRGKACFWNGAALAVGGALGWGALVRAEALVLAFVFPWLAGAFVKGRTGSWRSAALSWVGIIFGLALVWAPWMWRAATLSRRQYGAGSIYHGSPFFFLRTLSAAAQPEYRQPTTPTPTPTPTPLPTPGSFVTPTSATSVDLSSRSGSLSFSISLKGEEEALPLQGSIPLTPTPTTTSTSSAPPTSPWYAPLWKRLTSVPGLGGLLQWPWETWRQWWAYIGRNVVTSWNAWPWTWRFAPPRRVVLDRPGVRGQPLTFSYTFGLGLHLSIWALGWTAIWRRHPWGAWAPWGIYGLYVVGLAFGRVGGGRYIVPLDWVPLIYYLAGWLVLFAGLWRFLGGVMPEVWWRFPAEPPSLRRSTWRPLVGALLLGTLSLSGVALERMAVAYVAQHPNLTPPRARRATVDEIAAQLEAWGAGENTLRLLAHLREQGWQPLWGFAYFPRYLRAGQQGGEWLKHVVVTQNTFFFFILDSRWMQPMALPLAEEPRPWPLGTESVALFCPRRWVPSQVTLFYAAALVVVREPDGTLHLYTDPHAQPCTP